MKSVDGEKFSKRIKSRDLAPCKLFALLKFPYNCKYWSIRDHIIKKTPDGEVGPDIMAIIMELDHKFYAN